MKYPNAFTLLEVMIVVVVLGVLAAVVIPRFGGITNEARSSALQGSLGGVRSSIASFRTRAVIDGSDPFPTLAQLTTPGDVLSGEIPVNPYNGLSNVQAVSAGAGASRTVSGTSSYGWNYYVDNSTSPPAAVFYANTDDQTSVGDGSGGLKTANEL